MEPKTIEQLQTAKANLEFDIRKSITDFIKSNDGLLPMIEVTYTTYNNPLGATRLDQIKVKASITI